MAESSAGTIPDQVQVAYSHDSTARAAFARQAAEDWQDFLVHRGRELRPGGRLVVLTMALDDSGDFGFRPLIEGRRICSVRSWMHAAKTACLFRKSA